MKDDKHQIIAESLKRHIEAHGIKRDGNSLESELPEAANRINELAQTNRQREHSR